MPAAANAAVVARRTLCVETQRRVQFVDITPLLSRAVADAGLAAGGGCFERTGSEQRDAVG